jgi:hypothetical protein
VGFWGGAHKLGKLAVLVAAAALVLAPASALAKKKHKKPKSLGPVVTTTALGNVSTGTGQVSQATATCPSGTKSVGGGFSAPYTGSNALSVYESFRSSEESWTVTAVDQTGMNFVIATAYCRRSTRAITDTTGAVAIPAGYPMSATASSTCPANSQLIAGGFQATKSAGNNFAFPEASVSTTPGTWTVLGVNNSGTAQAVTSHAYCMTGIRKPTLVSATGSSTVGLYGKVSATTPTCPTPKKAKKRGKRRKKKPVQQLSAGGFSSPPGSLGNAVPVYTDSSAAAGGWLATAVNANVGTAVMSVTSQGVCV